MQTSSMGNTGSLKSCLANLILFCGKITLLVGEGKAVDIIFLHFSKALDTVPHIIHLDSCSAVNGINRFMAEGQSSKDLE